MIVCIDTLIAVGYTVRGIAGNNIVRVARKLNKNSLSGKCGSEKRYLRRLPTKKHDFASPRSSP